MHLADIHKALRDADTVIEKAVAAREVARIARIETLLRKYVIAEWDRLARQAGEEAARIVRAGDGKMTQREADRVVNAISKRMRRWSGRVRPRFLDDLEDVYRLARIAGWRKATGRTSASLQYNTKPFSAKPKETTAAPLKVVRKAGEEALALFPSFDLTDQEAIAALQRDQAFWIGEHYDTHVRGAIAETARREMIESGRSRASAGVRMEAVVRGELGLVGLPGGWRGSSDAYFEALVANATTVGRVQGQLRSFAEARITKYEIVNPGDERTCPVCSHMDGKKFFVRQGLDQMELDVTAESPADVRETHPWIRAERLLEISPRAGDAGPKDAESLAGAGFSLPPFHFRCRCTVDIVDE